MAYPTREKEAALDFFLMDFREKKRAYFVKSWTSTIKRKDYTMPEKVPTSGRHVFSINI